MFCSGSSNRHSMDCDLMACGPLENSIVAIVSVFLLSVEAHKHRGPRYILYGSRQQRTGNCYSINCDDHSDSISSSQNILKSTRVKLVIRIGPAAMACNMCVYMCICAKNTQ